LQLLVQDKMMLPTDKKLGSSMSGAFLIWTPLLRTFCHAGVLDIGGLVECVMRAMNASAEAARATLNPEMDPIREGMQDWGVHVLTGEEWAGVRGAAERQLVENVLGSCFSHPTFWNLRVAERLLASGRVEDVRSWRAVLEAARAEGVGEEKMDVDVDVEGIERALPVRENEGKDGVVKEKIRGPTKVLGMWKPRPIGWLPEGWEDDE
jgi:ribosomal biogenesis protein LAS1